MSSSLILPDVMPPHAAENYLGVWAIRVAEFGATFDIARRADLPLHITASAADVRAEIEAVRGGYDYDLTDGIATVSLSGSTTKHYNSFSGGTSTLFMRRTMNSLRTNDDVKAAILRIDSPGGSVAGQADFAASVAALAAAKPTVAFIEDLGASAAYWTASQARRIYSNATAIVGSIGTYGVVYDYSGAAEQAGVRAVVVKAGKFKGMGTPGTEITEEQQAELQRTVDTLNEFFLAAVAEGRGLSRDKVAEIATGETWIGQGAASVGLIDGVRSFDEVVAELRDEISPASNTRSPRMGATLAELKAACVGASAEFLMEQLEADSTVEQATRDWMLQQQRDRESLAAKLESETKARETAEAEAEKARQQVKAGVDPVHADATAGGADSADPIEAFQQAVKEEMTASRCSRQEAHKRVCRDQPAVRDAYLAAYNTRHPHDPKARQAS